ncbi:MAG: DUF1189 domain-containing protein [Elusimicrobiota bacterium]|jgi:hypothetical protein|nr:DUF1189 domain-containing protein [Elusimicrobiota bacterium]
MFLGPVKALFSMDFYAKYIKKSGWLACLFVFYTFIITCVFIALITTATGKARMDAVVDKLASYTPEIVIQNGHAQVNGGLPLTIMPEELEGYQIVFETAADEPVYPTQMETSRTMIKVTQTKVYLNYNGQFQESVLPDNLNLTISPQTLGQNKPKISAFMLYTLTIMMMIAQFLKIPFMILLAFLAAAMLNTYARAAVTAGGLLKLACYLQAPSAVLFLLNYAAPFKLPALMVIYFALYLAYSYFIFAKFIAGGKDA